MESYEETNAFNKCAALRTPLLRYFPLLVPIRFFFGGWWDLFWVLVIEASSWAIIYVTWPPRGIPSPSSLTWDVRFLFLRFEIRHAVIMQLFGEPQTRTAPDCLDCSSFWLWLLKGHFPVLCRDQPISSSAKRTLLNPWRPHCLSRWPLACQPWP